MRSILRKSASLIFLSGLLIWIIGGARFAFPSDSEYVTFIEPITEIEDGYWQNKYLPGVETLAIGIILGGSFFLSSFLFGKQSYAEPN